MTTSSPGRRTRRAAKKIETPAEPVAGMKNPGLPPPGGIPAAAPPGETVEQEVNRRLAAGEDVTAVLEDVKSRPRPITGPVTVVAVSYVTAQGATGFDNIVVDDLPHGISTLVQLNHARENAMAKGGYARVAVLSHFVVTA